MIYYIIIYTNTNGESEIYHEAWTTSSFLFKEYAKNMIHKYTGWKFSIYCGVETNIKDVNNNRGCNMTNKNELKLVQSRDTKVYGVTTRSKYHYIKSSRLFQNRINHQIYYFHTNLYLLLTLLKKYSTVDSCHINNIKEIFRTRPITINRLDIVKYTLINNECENVFWCK